MLLQKRASSGSPPWCALDVRVHTCCWWVGGWGRGHMMLSYPLAGVRPQVVSESLACLSLDGMLRSSPPPSYILLGLCTRCIAYEHVLVSKTLLPAEVGKQASDHKLQPGSSWKSSRCLFGQYDLLQFPGHLEQHPRLVFRYIQWSPASALPGAIH